MQYKKGDLVWVIFRDGDPSGRFWGCGQRAQPFVVSGVGREEEGGSQLVFVNALPFGFELHQVFASREEAIREAIRRNEGLQSELTLEIGRLKEELASIA